MNETLSQKIENLTAELKAAQREALGYRAIILEFMMRTSGNSHLLSDMKQERENVRIIARNILDMSVEIGKLKTDNEALRNRLSKYETLSA